MLNANKVDHITKGEDGLYMYDCEGNEIAISAEDLRSFINSSAGDKYFCFGYNHGTAWVLHDRIISVTMDGDGGRLRYDSQEGWEVDFEMPQMSDTEPDFVDLVLDLAEFRKAL